MAISMRLYVVFALFHLGAADAEGSGFTIAAKDSTGQGTFGGSAKTPTEGGKCAQLHTTTKDKAVEILPELQECIGDVISKAEKVQEANQASKKANEEYKLKFQKVFHALKELKDSNLADTFQANHQEVWRKLNDKAGEIKATLETMMTGTSSA